MKAEEYIERLDENTSMLVSVLKSCTPIQLVYKKDAATWSALEIAEHILIAEKLVYMVLKRPSHRTSEKEEIYGPKKLFHILIELGDRRFDAPQTLMPKGKLESVASFESQLRQMREKEKEALLSGSMVIDSRTYSHPLLGEMTVTDWLNFIILHAERHLQQMRNRIAECK
jgi:hypothetical protein